MSGTHSHRFGLTLTFALGSGNIIIIASSSSVIIALSWAGVQFSWSSAQVLAPLLVGLAGILLFFLYEKYIAQHPLVRVIMKGVYRCLTVRLDTDAFCHPDKPYDLERVGRFYYFYEEISGSGFISSYVQTFLNPVIMLGVICELSLFC